MQRQKVKTDSLKTNCFNFLEKTNYYFTNRVNHTYDMGIQLFKTARGK